MTPDTGVRGMEKGMRAEAFTLLVADGSAEEEETRILQAAVVRVRGGRLHERRVQSRSGGPQISIYVHF